MGIAILISNIFAVPVAYAYLWLDVLFGCTVLVVVSYPSELQIFRILSCATSQLLRLARSFCCACSFRADGERENSVAADGGIARVTETELVFTDGTSEGRWMPAR